MKWDEMGNGGLVGVQDVLEKQSGRWWVNLKMKTAWKTGAYMAG